MAALSKIPARRIGLAYIALTDYSDDLRLDSLLDGYLENGTIVNYWSCMHPAVDPDLPFGHRQHYHYLLEFNCHSCLWFVQDLVHYFPKLFDPTDWVLYVSHDSYSGVVCDVSERQECY